MGSNLEIRRQGHSIGWNQNKKAAIQNEYAAFKMDR
jgi:hypothetical protein